MEDPFLNNLEEDECGVDNTPNQGRRRGILIITFLVIVDIVLFLSLRSYAQQQQRNNDKRKETSLQISNVRGYSIESEEIATNAKETGLRRILGRESIDSSKPSGMIMQTVMVHHKISTATHTKTNNKNSNVGDSNFDYRPTYHYTTPLSIQDSKLYDTFDPKIAWLASFPNSGTSFTMGLVAMATNTTFATNYGIEANYGDRSVPSLPIYPQHSEGPYMPDPATSFHHRELPYGNFVLTKTHCGGYCSICRPEKYAYGYENYKLQQQSQDASNDPTSPEISFLGDCASGMAVDHQGSLVDVSYPPERVAKVIHLIRNPIHNAIARFHLERKHHKDANTDADREWLANHPDNLEGMTRFCADENDSSKWAKEDTKFFQSTFFENKKAGLHQDFEAWKDLVKRVPCRADFFRYIQWHNLLHQSMDHLPYKLPVLTLYYEGFETSTYQDTAHTILEFLELELVRDKRGNIKWNKFQSRDDYDDFFSDQQTKDIRDFLKSLASFRVWGEIEHYFR